MMGNDVREIHSPKLPIPERTRERGPRKGLRDPRLRQRSVCDIRQLEGAYD